MKIKTGASLGGLQFDMRKALVTAEQIYNNHHKELVITSGTDGEHSAGSFHYYGYAIDIRTRHLDKDLKNLIFQQLCEALKHSYIVVLESTHIHIQYNGKNLPNDSQLRP